ncbi:MAG: glycosyltransferase family 2 protein [Nitrospinae bacterium]|nr:glycosyltransferase family 2 protein [Nitrospinota bacterium]
MEIDELDGRGLLSIGIVNYNNKKELKNCLSSIEETIKDIQKEVFVCDNNSSDGSADMVRKDFPDVNLIRNSKNLGLSKAINIILKSIGGDYFLLLDSDTELRHGAIQYLLKFLNNNPDVGIVGPRIYTHEGAIQESARRFPNFLNGLFGRRSLMTRIFPNNSISKRFLCIDYINATEPFEVDFVIAACILTRKEVIDKVGVFDEDFFVYWSEVDWCRRVKSDKYKYRVFCVPSAKIIHYERYKPWNWKKGSPRMIKDFNKGAYLYYRKHHVKNRFSLKNLMAISMLSLRTGILLCVNHFKR